MGTLSPPPTLVPSGFSSYAQLAPRLKFHPSISSSYPNKFHYNSQRQLRRYYRSFTTSISRSSDFSSSDEDIDKQEEPSSSSRKFEEAVELFNRKEYYACHDLLEALWYNSHDPARTLLHGILQCAVGFHHLFNQLLELDDSKEAVYGTLDAWVAWEQNFPIASLKNVLLALEKEQQWHRVVQVIKWTLSKGQGNTMGTYRQLIRALDMDHRAEEAHKIWVKKIGNDLHSVPWQLCNLMISVYYRNNMLESLVKLFKDLEAFDRKPPEKLIVRKVANAYEILGLIDEKERVLEKYSDLFNETRKEAKKKSKKAKSLKKEKTPGNVDTVTDVMDRTQAD